MVRTTYHYLEWLLMSRFARYFGLVEAPNNAVRLAKVMATLMPAYAMAFSISTTFWLVFIAEELGNGSYMAGLSMVGILVVVQLGIQTLLDYPTGALGDHIGHKYVITSAMLCYALTFWLTSTVTADSPYYIFVAIYALLGIARSQESGAWGAWFDSNFRAAHPDDEGRQQYGVFQGKLGMLFGLANTIVLIPGGWLALSLGRQWVFQLQSVAYILLSIVVLRYLNDLPEVEQERKKEKKEISYTSLLREGLMFLGSDRFVTLFIAGEVLIFAVVIVYGNIILFPFYYVYLLTDVAVAAFRTFMYVPQVPLQERSGVWAKRFSPGKWIPRFYLLMVGSTVPLLIMGGLLLTIPPPTDISNLIRFMLPGTEIVILEFPTGSTLALFAIAVLFIFGFLVGSIGVILSQRVLLDIIPNRIRNSVYSLRPTLVILVAMPFSAISGELSSRFGFPPVFILLSIVSTVGAYLIHRAFKRPTPKAADLEVILADKIEELKH